MRFSKSFLLSHRQPKKVYEICLAKHQHLKLPLNFPKQCKHLILNARKIKNPVQSLNRSQNQAQDEPAKVLRKSPRIENQRNAPLSSKNVVGTDSITDTDSSITKAAVSNRSPNNSPNNQSRYSLRKKVDVSSTNLSKDFETPVRSLGTIRNLKLKHMNHRPVRPLRLCFS